MKQRKKKTFERKTEADIKKLEKQLRVEYKQAAKELTEKYEKKMAAFAEKDAVNKALVANGEMTEEAYQTWRRHQLIDNKRVKSMIDELSRDIANTNRQATAIINKKTAQVFTETSNFQMYEIEKQLKVMTSFSLVNKDTVVRLALVPEAKTKLAKDIMWNSRKIRSAIMQGMIQGESVPKIAKRLKTVARMNYSASVRNARTFVTAAENSARQFSMEYSESVGVKMKKAWLATLDDRTRDSHALLDGETVDIDEPFSNGLMFPADVDSGDPSEVYNCRCTMVSVVDGIDMSFNPDEVTRANKLGDMSYEEWKKAHEKR
jgi:SPP1 gp7 family putative phage head morphogenesis protein